ncbi:3-isopropylmalate dehydratase small subunit 3 [Phtheirospermum japonicum]|uniref:3-isopropylmalate dehydratase small subunit 3 n=1 Tax=Phtheirospermum japonicum TaxID=374723 RepID=A0A830BZG6_9LAMI|nr:3-isopropylmalate dehydratase small subunit 3 [Phtheirospermum japonicum]
MTARDSSIGLPFSANGGSLHSFAVTALASEKDAALAAVPSDSPTIFDKILNKQIPDNIVYEDDKAEVRHCEILGHLLYTAKLVAKQEGLDGGFRLVINDGAKWIGGVSEALTSDHRPSRQDEQDMIEVFHAPVALGASGVAVVVAESYSRIFFKNSVATGEVYPLESEGRLCEECRTGDVVTNEFGELGESDNYKLMNHTSGKEYKLKANGMLALSLRLVAFLIMPERLE